MAASPQTAVARTKPTRYAILPKIHTSSGLGRHETVSQSGVAWAEGLVAPKVVTWKQIVGRLQELQSLRKAAFGELLTRRCRTAGSMSCSDTPTRYWNLMKYRRSHPVRKVSREDANAIRGI